MLNPEFLIEQSGVARIAKATGLDPLADAIQPAIRAGRDSSPWLKGALSGTWIGHTLHPILTDIPIGAFTALAALDVAELAGAGDVARGADVTLGVGLAGAYAAVITGWSDWSDTHEEPRRLGLAHALVNGAAVIAYDASLVLRVRKKRKAAIAASLVGYAILSVGAYLGGELSMAMHLGIKHVAQLLAPPSDFIDVAALSDLQDNSWLRVDAGGIPVLLSRDESGVFAIAGTCTHRGAPLDEGTREGGCVRCPWHGARFSLQDGSVVEGPATFGLPQFETRVADGRIAVRAAV